MKNLTTEFKRILKNYGLEWFNRYYGNYRGLVVDNKDPSFLGRITLTCSAVYGDEIYDDWVFPKGIPSGKNWGLFAIPQPGDLVWVSFENGDSQYPIWEYGHWAQNEVPEKAKRSDVSNYMFQSPAGQRIEFDDKNGEVLITNKDGNFIRITKDGFHVERSGVDARKLFDQLFTLFSQTNTATNLGPQPFINIAEYELLKKDFQKLFF